MRTQRVIEAPVVIAFAFFSFAAPAVAAAQGDASRVVVQGSLGTQLAAWGDTESLAIGYQPAGRIGFLVGAERLHIWTRVRHFTNGSSKRRGGSSTFLSGEVRFPGPTFGRISNYGFVGIGRGQWSQNVNAYFPVPGARGDASLLFVGGGVRLPVNDHLSAFVDVRLAIQVDHAEDGGYPFLPLRGGFAWRF